MKRLVKIPTRGVLQYLVESSSDAEAKRLVEEYMDGDYPYQVEESDHEITWSGVPHVAKDVPR